MLPHEVPDNVVYDVVIDGFLVKENKLKVRLLWDLDNKARTRFQKTINDAAPFFDNPEFHIAIEKSLQKQYEKLGGELALQIAETLHKVRSTHDLHDCLVCLEKLEDDYIAVFLNNDYKLCSATVAHGVHKACSLNTIKNIFKI